ncbi:MAG: hypothetical protein JO306_02645 [Gemmatimonadetes bacterium]|nr:hypothetical protein [Gemmatimonadota bacterium]
MRKLMLKVDDLSVESFRTHEAPAELLGTVEANEATLRGCSGVATCFTSCRGDMRDQCTCPPPA